jgi:hypothetical protein
MNSYFSLIKFVNNSDSNENIVVGLIVVSGNKLYYNISQSKLTLSKKLNPIAWKLFNYSLDKFNYFIHEDNELIKNQLKFFSSSIDKNYLSRLSNYQNGVFQISEPETINKEFDLKSFYTYFKKFVGNDVDKPHPSLRNKEFKQRLEKYYSIESFKRVDLHYKINPDIIPGLFFPIEVEFIAKNGQLLVGQALDFNLQTNTIAKKFNEFENLVHNLEKFSINKGIGRGEYKLIIGRPRTNSEQEKIFNDIYRKKSEAPFEIIYPEELNNVAKVLEDQQFEKFSDYIKSNPN